MLRNRLFVSVSLGHMLMDVLNSVGPVLLAVLAVPLALSNAQIGLALTLYTFAGSLSQPLFGWVADRAGNRATALGALGLLWTTLLYVGVALAGSWALLLPCFILASLGSGLFHPIGTATAASAQRANAGRATATFFFFGQAGLAIGPVVGGLLFGRIGALGVLPLCLLALVPTALMLTAPAAPAIAVAHGAPTRTKRYEAALFALVAFIALVAVRSSIQAGYQSFLPKLFADKGWQPEIFGLMSGTFMFAAAIGNIVTGIAADRFGMRAATIWPLLLSVPSGLICLWAPTVAAAFIASALAGLFICGQHSVLVVHAQRLLPTQQGFASGLILGFTFAAGGVGTWVAGIAADHVGLLPTMQVLTLLALPCALLALTLPGHEDARTRHTSHGSSSQIEIRTSGD